MHVLRAIRISAVSYLATLAIGLAGLQLLGIQIDPAVEPSASVILFSMILATLLTGAGAVWYFLPPNVPGGAKAGIKFGITATLVAFGLDGVLVIMGIAAGQDPGPWFTTAYQHWFLSVMLLVGLGVCTLVGAAKTRHNV